MKKAKEITLKQQEKVGELMHNANQNTGNKNDR